MDGLTALRNVFARTRNGVTAREESGTDDQKQSDESRHFVLLPQIFGDGNGGEPETARVPCTYPIQPEPPYESNCRRVVGQLRVESTHVLSSRLNGGTHDRFSLRIQPVDATQRKRERLAC